MEHILHVNEIVSIGVAMAAIVSNDITCLKKLEVNLFVSLSLLLIMAMATPIGNDITSFATN